MRMEQQVALRNMKYYKRRNILIGIAIILTTILMLVVPSIGKGMVDAQYAAINRIYPSWHALFRSVDEETVLKLGAYHEITNWGVRSDIGKLCEDGITAYMMYMDEAGCELYNIHLKEGRLPKAENEIVVYEEMLQAIGEKSEIGAHVTLDYQVFRGTGLDLKQHKEFVVTGFLAGEENLEKDTYTTLHSKEFLVGEVPGNEINYRFLCQVELPKDAFVADAENKINQIAEQFGIDSENVHINEDYLGANYVDPSMASIITIIMVIIVIAGIITIYSIYYVGMSSQIKEYGKLKAMGTTRRQLRKIVLFEGLFVAAISIPIGLVIGTLLTRGVFRVMLVLFEKDNDMIGIIKAVFTEGEVTLIYPLLYVIAIVVTLFTVYVSLRKPMKMVASVSEMEAIRFQGTEGKNKKKSRKSHKDMKLIYIARNYLFGNPKNTFVTIGAMSVTGIFVMVVASVLASANPASSASASILGQYKIELVTQQGNKEHPEWEWSQVILNNPINEELLHKIQAIDGVEDAIIFHSVKYSSDFTDGYQEDMTGVPEYYAMDLIDGIIEGSTTYEELKSGDKVILDNNLLHWYPQLNIGDKLDLQITDGQENHHKIVEIVAIADYPIGFTNFGYLLMAEEGLEKVCDKQTADRVQILAADNYDPAIENTLKQLIAGEDCLALETWQENYETWKQGLVVTSAACYAFLSILGVICIMNMVNTMIHNVHLRKKELGMMQAIGMSDSQLTKLLLMEGAFYTVGTLVLSVGIGSALGYPMFLWAKKTAMFNIRYYHYPIAATIIVIIVLSFVQAILAIVIGKSVKKESLIERVRYSE